MEKLICDKMVGGVVHTNFRPNKCFQDMCLSFSAQKILNVPNAGGNSVLSEVLSFELLKNCFKANLLKTEMEVEYYPMGGSITDYVCHVFQHKVGVSVTRAIKFIGQFTQEDASLLLNKKLKGVNQANRNSLENWSKQILHVWTQTKDDANQITKAFATIDLATKHNTVVLVTVAEKAEYIFKNK